MHNQLLQQLASFCASRGINAWLVGGTPRDFLLGRPVSDLDLAVDVDGVALARSLADILGGSFVLLDSERGTGRVVLPASADSATLVIDLVQLRAATIEADLALRDVTINALAWPLRDDGELPIADLIDPLGGATDLAGRRLRACGPTSISDDPLRIMRVVRLAAVLGFVVTPELDVLLRASAGALTSVAAERVRDELLKLLTTPVAGSWLRYLDQIGVLTTLIPELEPARNCDQPRVHFLPVLAHSLETVVVLDWLLQSSEGQDAASSVPTAFVASVLSAEHLPVAIQHNPTLRREPPYAAQIMAGVTERRSGGVPRLALLKLAALLHDNAKPQTKERHPDGSVSFYGHQDLGAAVANKVAQRLRIGRADSAYISMVVREHMRPGQLRAAGELTRRAVVRLFRDLGEEAADVLVHELADHMATRGPATTVAGWEAHLEWIGQVLQMHYEQPPAPVAPLLRGDELMAALDLPAGPLVGELLREIAEARASGEISEPDEALALARRLHGAS